LVFDTSLLAAFDVPGVDPAAQQQAANLLSQQPNYQNSITPPSLPGAGLSEPRPQTVTQGAPYYDPIAIHQGTAPVNYVGPTVDMSGYLGNLFSPSNTGTTNYGPAIGGTGWATSTSDPTSRYGGTNSTDFNAIVNQQIQQQQGPGPLGGMIANRVAGGIDTLRDIGGAIGDINIPTGWRGQTTIGEQLGNVVDTYNTDIPYYSDAMRNTIIPALESGVNAIAPYTPIAPYNWVANATGLPSAGEIAGYTAPVTLGDVVVEAIPGVGTLPDAWRAASRLSPDLTDFSRVIREGGQNVSQRLGPGELGAARIPGPGPRDPRDWMDEALRNGPVIQNADESRAYDEAIEAFDAAKRGNKKTPDAINAISRRLKGGDEKPIFEGIEQAAETPAAPKPLPGTEAYVRGRGTTAPPPDYSQDPGYLESLARQADTGVSNPARTKTTAPAQRTVTQGDGTVLPATDETIKAAVDRFTRRPTSAKLIKTDPVADPEGFLDELAAQVVNAKTRGGRPLMSGVTKEQVKQSLVNISNNMAAGFIKSTPPAATTPSSATAPTAPAPVPSTVAPKAPAAKVPVTPAAQAAPPASPPKPPSGTAQAALPPQVQDWLDFFTQQTRGVIDNTSIGQAAYDLIRPATRWVSGDVADSKLAELISREAELRAYLGPLNLVPKDLNKAVFKWRGEQLANYFTGPELKKAAQFMQQNAKGRSATDFTDELNETLKSGALTLDVAVAGQQIEAGLRRGAVPIVTGVMQNSINRVASKMHMPGMLNVYLRDDIPQLQQLIADGFMPPGAASANVAQKGKTLYGRVPVAGKYAEAGLEKLVDLQYGAALGTLRKRAAEGLLLQNKIIHDITFGKLGGDISDPLVRRHIMEQANMIGSTSREATQVLRSRVENKGLLTARMTRAQVNEVLTPLKALRSQEDTVALMNLIGSTVAYLGVAKFLNDKFGISDFVWNPLEQGFGQIKTDVEDEFGRKQIIDFMPQDALITAVIRSINALKDNDMERLRDSWLRFGAGRLNMLPSDLIKFSGYGYDSTGRFHGPGDERMSIKEAAKASAPVPITARDIYGDQSLFNVATAITGQGNFPENETQVKDRLAVEMFGQPSETYPNGVKSYSELYNTDKDKVDENSAVQAAEAFNGPTPLDLVGQKKEADRNTAATGQLPEDGVDWLKNSGLKPASEIDRQLAAGEITGAEARAAYQALREELVRRDMQNRESPEVQQQLAEIEKAVAEKGEQSLSPAEKAQRDYYAMLDAANTSGTFDFDLYNQKLDEWVAQYGDQRDLISASRAPLSPGEAELKELRTQLDSVGWFDSYDRGYQSILRNNPQVAAKFGQYQDYDSFEAGMKQRITDSLRRQYGTQYIDQDKVNDIFFDIMVGEGIMQAVNVVEAVILYRNPNLMQPIQKWYDLDEGEMKVLEEIRRSNGAVAR